MDTQEVNLYWHKYKFFPYEKRFAVREVHSLLEPLQLTEFDDRLMISGVRNRAAINKLVYFSHAEIDKEIFTTLQFHFESGGGKAARQNTRYSVHGLHEYKGKFNPQVVRSLFNIYGVQAGDKILDPFCGSGTTLVESAHDGISAYGTDINPLAVFIANTKIEALRLPASEIKMGKDKFVRKYLSIKKRLTLDHALPRVQYLEKWFLPEQLVDIEALRSAALEMPDSIKNIFLVITSNLLRDYSLQEPSDLRIRRRFSPFPDVPFIQQLETAVDSFASNIASFQTSFVPIRSSNKAFNVDIKGSGQAEVFSGDNTYDFAVTSPPYATALPYIDTQRLSLVWLDLISAKEIKTLESNLIGSRDYKAKAEQRKWQDALQKNDHALPDEIHSFCLDLNSQLDPSDGFRKKALPSLLYRYFHDMGLAFREVHRLLKKGKYFCLIVGHNHTNIGGKRTDIDTPTFLSHMGKQIGFEVDEIVELEAYQRYGLHSSNAVQKESLIVFKK